LPNKALSPGDLPQGCAYRQGFLTEQEEKDLLKRFESLPFHNFEFQGYTALRRIVEYGFEYDFSSRRAAATQALPGFLQSFRERAAAWASVDRDEIVESVITEYPPGAPIGWHRDVPQFEIIIGISLKSSCRMRFKPYGRKGEITKAKIVSMTLEPRSAYIMRDAARWNFQHSIPAVKELRYSITFRTARKNKP
jgi:alkylated DNA repair dioxygenase AlkB